MVDLRRAVLIALTCYVSFAQAQVVEWVTGTSGKWHEASNWVGGIIPTASDSAVISGAGSEVLLSLDAEALHVTVTLQAKMEIDIGNKLTIENSPGDGLFIGALASVENRGLLSIYNTAEDGIDANDRLVNQAGGVISVDETQGDLISLQGSMDTIYNYGRMILSNGDAMRFSGVGVWLVHANTIEISNAEYGLLFFAGAGGSLLEGSYTEIENVVRTAIDLRHDVIMTNKGTIQIDGYGQEGIATYGTLTNSGDITIVDSASASGTALVIDSFTCCGPIHLGEIHNYGSIEVNGCITAVSLDNSTTLINDGEIVIFDCESGILAEPRSITNLKSSSSFEIDQASSSPLDFALEALFQVHLNAVFDADL